MSITPQATRYDHAARRRGVRHGRERGCWVYIPAEELRKANIDPHEAPPWYRIWANRTRILIQFYREP